MQELSELVLRCVEVRDLDFLGLGITCGASEVPTTTSSFDHLQQSLQTMPGASLFAYMIYKTNIYIQALL